MKTMPSLVVAVAVSAATLSAAPKRTCLFTPAGGAPRDLVIADWSATVNGAPHELAVGEHRCGFHRFRDGWTFPGFDPRQRNEVVMTGTFEAPSDGEVAAGLTGDWFYDLALDGKAVFSTGSGGNGTSEYGYWNKTARFPVTAGRHTLTATLRNGMGGMMFALGKPEARPVVAKEPVAVADALAAARRIWAGDVYERNNAKRRADMAVVQRAIDMTSGADFGKAVRGDRSAALFAKAPALAVIDAAVDRILAEVPVTKVAKGTVAVWYYYDMGHVVKTPGGTVFGIDLSGPRDAELADLLDFALVTHNHGDHASERVLRAMQRKGGFTNGKPVVSSFMYSPWHARTPKTYTFGDCTVETGVTDHNAYWTESMTPYKVTCGRGPEAVTLLHAGDGWDGAQLARFAPVDVAICHVWPFDGHNAEKTASVLKPDLLVVSHAQEMSHGFGPGRWDWSACEEEAARATAAGTAIYPVWGERFVWRKRSLKPALLAKELPAGTAADDAAFWAGVPGTRLMDMREKYVFRGDFPQAVKFAWDAQNLYFRYEVTDDDIFHAAPEKCSNLYAFGDTMELFLQPEGARAYWEFHFAASGRAGAIWFPSRGKRMPEHVRYLPFDGLKNAVAVAGTLNDDTDRDERWSGICTIPWASIRTKFPAYRPGDPLRVQATGVVYSRYARGEEKQQLFHTPGLVCDPHTMEDWCVLRFE